MKKSRFKVSLTSIASRDEAEGVMNDLALMANEQRRLIADRDAEVLAVNAAFESPLAECAEDLRAKTDALRAWAESNPDQFPKDRKSIEFLSGKLGFRTGNPTIALGSRAFTWAKVLTLVVNRKMRKLLRTRLEVDKEAVLARCGTLKAPTRFQTKVLPTLGLKLMQQESFFVEPALTEVDTRQTEEAS